MGDLEVIRLCFGVKYIPVSAIYKLAYRPIDLDLLFFTDLYERFLSSVSPEGSFLAC